jgi:hypothetical protein
LEWRLDGFSFPHDVARHPLDGTLAVLETGESQVVWVEGSGASAEPLHVLTEADGLGHLPNGFEQLEHEGRVLGVISHRGVSLSDQESGGIALWDWTDPEIPVRLWTFPAEGGLAVPHSPILRAWGGVWWLVWAHTEGAADGTGSVGLAMLADPLQPPVYVADLVPTGGLAPFTFLRGVDLDDAGQLVVTDSGTGFGYDRLGRLLTARTTELQPTGASGVAGVDQVFVDLADLALLTDGLDNPFEGWWWDGFSEARR